VTRAETRPQEDIPEGDSPAEVRNTLPVMDGLEITS
jgi:hypothetical protein